MIRDPEFIWARYRSVLTRREIQEKESVLFLNAGSLPEIRYITSFRLPKIIAACDNHSTIDPENINNWSAKKNKISCTKEDLFIFLDQLNAKNIQYSAIIINNGSLYYYSNIEKIIQMVTKVLKPGGFFMFDIQISHWNLVCAAYVFGIYPNVASVPNNKEEVLKKISKICQKNWGLSYEYLEDPINKEPTSIVIKIIKQYFYKTFCLIHSYMAIPAATPTFTDLVEPKLSISRISSQLLITSSVNPFPSLPKTRVVQS